MKKLRLVSEEDIRRPTMCSPYMRYLKKYLSKRQRKLYAAFIDLRKAIDSTKRETLLKTLCREEVSSEFVDAIKAIYQKVLSCVTVNSEFTDMFQCPQGLS